MIREINIISKGFREILERNNVRGYALSLEFGKLSKVIKTNAEFSISDVNTNMLAIQLLNNNSPVLIEESSVVYANIERADGTVVTNKCQVIDGSIGAILVKFSKLSNEIVGTNKLEIVVCYTNSEKIVSPKISYKTFQSIESYYEIPEQDEVDVLDILVDEVTTLKKDVINTNSEIEQEMAERVLIYNKFDEAEKERVSNELERQASHESLKSTEESVTRNEESRKESMEQIVSDFNGCMGEFNSKIGEVDAKILEVNSNEQLREQEHSERVEYFDEIIKVDHQNIVEAEEERELEETKRNEAELKREQFIVDVEDKIESWSIQEEARAVADNTREERVRTLEEIIDTKINETDTHIRTLEERVDSKIDETSSYVVTLENRVEAKIAEYNTATLITNAEIDTIIANALK